MITISQLKKVDKPILTDINQLLPQISKEAKAYSQKELALMVRDPHITVLVARKEKRILGMGLLFMYRKSLGLYAIIEDVVVDKQYRGKGIGKALMEKLMNRAKTKNACYIDLTSRPERTEANAFYQRLGFEKRNTNVYRLSLAK